MRKCLVLVLLCCIAPAMQSQHILRRLDIQVVLRNDGSASVCEQRQVEVGPEGTEGYITFNDMGDIRVCDLQVSDEQDSSYVVEEDWDVDRSRERKRGRCGYHYTEEGVELCWGLGDAGERTYEICYTLTNLVKSYTDYDGFCHSFYEVGNSPARQAHLKIRLEDDSLTTKNAAIWTFGYHGYKGFADGLCEATADGSMSYDEAIIVLLQLKKGLLSPSVQKEESFTETVKQKALEGSDYNLEDAGLGSQASRPFSGFFSSEEDDRDVMIGFAAFVTSWIIILTWYTQKKKKDRKLERERLCALFSTLMGGKKYEELPYCRDLPCGDNLLMSGAILSSIDRLAAKTGSSLLDVRYNLQHLYEALVLRMVYKGTIRLEYDPDEQQHLFFIKSPVLPEPGEDLTELLTRDRIGAASMSYNPTLGNSKTQEAKLEYQGYVNDAGIEYHLQRLLYEASGDDHLLQPSELKTFVRENPMAWRPFTILLCELMDNTLDEQKLNADEVQQVVGFLRYLRDFSLVAERHIEEVALWKEYLVFATFYGIADQVRTDMKKVAPDVARLDSLVAVEQYIEDVTPLTEAIASTLTYVHSYMTSAEREILYASSSSSDDSSSGGSGYSSYDGGGGHSGGGGSGFR